MGLLLKDRLMMSRAFRHPGNNGVVVFSPEVLAHMYGHAQRGYFAREAGGQLFSPVVHRPVVEVTHSTGPNPGDRRSRHKIDWDVAQADADRATHFANGRHVIGLWHTHPEANPSPSGQDEKTTRQFLDALEGNMQGFLLIIVGNKGETPNMGVWVAQVGPRKSWVRLIEEANATIKR